MVACMRWVALKYVALCVAVGVASVLQQVRQITLCWRWLVWGVLCCSVLQCALQCVLRCVLQCVAVCVAVCCSVCYSSHSLPRCRRFRIHSPHLTPTPPLRLQSKCVPARHQFYAFACVEVWCSYAFLCVAVCCSVLQCVAACCSVLQCPCKAFTLRICVCCCVLQCDAMCCSMLQRPYNAFTLRICVCCSVLQCDAVCCSMLQCPCKAFTLRISSERCINSALVGLTREWMRRVTAILIRWWMRRVNASLSRERMRPLLESECVPHKRVNVSLVVGLMREWIRRVNA